MVAEGVGHKGGRKVTSSHEQIRRIDAEDGGVEELEERHRQHDPEGHSVPQTLLDVVQMGWRIVDMRMKATVHRRWINSSCFVTNSGNT